MPDIWAIKAGDSVAKRYAGTAAGLQAAADAIHATGTGVGQGGTIFMPPGTIDLGTTTITIYASTTLRGAGFRSSYLTYSGTATAINLGVNDGNHAGATEAYNGNGSLCVLADFFMQGPGIGTAAQAINDWDSGGNVFERVSVSGFGTGFFGIGADGNSFYDCLFLQCAKGCHLGSRSDQTHFFNPRFSQCTIGLNVEYAHGTVVHGGQSVFNTTADVVLDCPASATQGGDVRGIESFTMLGHWYESPSSPQTPRHIWVGANGTSTSTRQARGILISGGLLFATNALYFIEIDAGGSVLIQGLRHEGNAITLVRNNAVSGVFPAVVVDDEASMLPSSVTVFSGQNALMVTNRRNTTQAVAYTTPFTPGANQQIVELGALTGNLAVNLPSSPVRGNQLTFRILQDGVGGRTVTWDAGYKQAWSDTGNTANKRTTITFYYDGTSFVQLGAQSPYL